MRSTFIVEHDTAWAARGNPRRRRDAGRIFVEVVAIYRAFMLNLSEALAVELERARAALVQPFGSITIEATEKGVVAERLRARDRVVLAGAGAQIGLVAGACSLIRKPVSDPSRRPVSPQTQRRRV